MFRVIEQEDRGASAVEYSFLVVAIAAVIVLIVFALGTFTRGAFEQSCDSLAAGSFSGGHTCR